MILFRTYHCMYKMPHCFPGPSEELRKASNHIVYKIRGDEFGLTAIEVESKLRSKLRENFEVSGLK